MRGLEIHSSPDKKKYVIGGAIAFVILIIAAPFLSSTYSYLKIATSSIDESICPVYDFKRPASFLIDNSTAIEIINDEKFRLKSVQKVSGAVQIDTTVFDNQPDVDDDPKLWANFAKFHKYLELTFPTVYALLEVNYVNTYGIVFHWKGSNKHLKPLMLAAHQDVVPVQKDTLDDWTYPPFEGHYDGEYLYGRGSSDCKNVLIAILESFELLISKGYKPKRSIVAAFGFDEEASGIVGAQNIAKYLEKTFGSDSMYAIIDEGQGLTTDANTNQVIAIPGTGEKGYLDILVELTTPGGHSSVPPDHTLIGIVSELAYLIEKDPYNSILTEKNPYLNYLQCGAVHQGKKGGLSSFMKKAILRAGFDKYANSKVLELLRANLLTKYLVTTSQAVDIIKGGEKVNALPEYTKMVVNHRVAIETSLDEVRSNFIERAKILANKYGLDLEGFGESIIDNKSSKGKFIILNFSSPLKSAPVTPVDDKVWEYLAGTTRHVFEDLVFTKNNKLDYPIVTAPSIMTGNTDTRYYWNLTKNIFRYSPMYLDDFVKGTNIHSVDEKLKFDNHLQLLTFFYEFIQNVDTAEANNK